MSIRKNSYEQKLVNRWRRYVCSREADEFLLRLREELYGDSYSQITAVKSGDGGEPHMPRLPKWAKDAFGGKLPYSNKEMQVFADEHGVPVEAVKVFGKNHHLLNEFRIMCEEFDETDKERLRLGLYENTLLDAADCYDREPRILSILSECSTSQLEALGEWAEEKYAIE